jgi:hypothetical protein
MKRSKVPDGRNETRPVMVWSITDAVIEDRVLRERQFRDLEAAGFGGVAAFVRCTRYSWDDPLAMSAWRHINDLCRKSGISCWLGPDPRFVSHKVTRDSSGLELVLFGNACRADVVPNAAQVQGGRYTVRCALTPRHVHTLTDVAVEYTPIGLARVYAFRRGAKLPGRKDIIDITEPSRQFYNARDRYVEAFGSVPDGIDENWSVIAFFRVRTNHFDFSNPQHLKQYDAMLATLKSSGCSPEGIMWDEPGYTCTYGSLPFSPSIRKLYQSSRKSALERDLWKLAFEADDSSHIPVRLAYYRAVQETILQAERRLQKTSHRLWGQKTIVGIHDTWHFESADMCDMNHGSLDLWKTARAKSGGFVDLGAVNLLKDPRSTHYANLATMSVAAASMGKSCTPPLAYSNLWTVGDDDGEGWQKGVLNHCVKIMALFGTRWLAHAYGPVGTVGQERTFLGSPPLPGYPDHSTWRAFPSWNTYLSDELKKTEGALPESSLLVLYPVESLYALADHRADAAAARIFNMVLLLLDHHYHFELLSTSVARHGRWRGKQFCVGAGRYDFIVFPYPEVIDSPLLRLISRFDKQILFAFGSPTFTERGSSIRASTPGSLTDFDQVLQRLSSFPGLQPVTAPGNCWTTITNLKRGTLVSLAPSRVGARFQGAVTFKNKVYHLPETDRLERVFFPLKGEPERW